MDWLKLALLGLQIIQSLIRAAERRKAFSEGERSAIAKGLAEIARKAGVADAVRAEIAAMTDEALDEELRGP